MKLLKLLSALMLLTSTGLFANQIELDLAPVVIKQGDPVALKTVTLSLSHNDILMCRSTAPSPTNFIQLSLDQHEVAFIGSSAAFSNSTESSNITWISPLKVGTTHLFCSYSTLNLNSVQNNTSTSNPLINYTMNNLVINLIVINVVP